MAQGDINVTIVGNITNDPELRFTPSGAAVASFTLLGRGKHFEGSDERRSWRTSRTTGANRVGWNPLSSLRLKVSICCTRSLAR